MAGAPGIGELQDLQRFCSASHIHCRKLLEVPVGVVD